MKKIVSALLVVLMLVGLAACGSQTPTSSDPTPSGSGSDELQPVSTELIQFDSNLDLSKVKIGVIFLHDPNMSTYDNNFYQAILAAQKTLGLTDDQLVFKWNIPEDGTDCYDTACEMIDAGCNIVFGDSFGYESNLKQVAQNNPNVQVCHATGTNAIVAGLANYHNAFASIYEGRYLAGVAAGMKINEMINSGTITAEKAKIGYVGAFPYAEVKSGYTSFFLGARSVCPSVTMEVVYTNSWFDIALEKEGALKLINDGCVLISQHADSEGAPKACEEAGVPNVAYNVDTTNLGPNTALISSKINWEPYFEMIIKCVASGKAIPTDWCGTLKTGSVQLTALNEKAAAEGTQKAIDDAKAQLEAGTVKVYDTKNFKVDGKELATYLADVKDMGDFQPETEVIKNGSFLESYYRSAPYFDLLIDGITEK